MSKKITRREFLTFTGAGLGAAALGFGPLRVLGQAGRTGAPVATIGERTVRPNILHIMTDDQDYQSWAEQFTRLDAKGKVLVDEHGEPLRGYAMPFLRSMPRGGWCDFTQNTCTSAICAPSRAGLLTGVPARENGGGRVGASITSMRGIRCRCGWRHPGTRHICLVSSRSAVAPEAASNRPAGQSSTAVAVWRSGCSRPGRSAFTKWLRTQAHGRCFCGPRTRISERNHYRRTPALI